MEFERPTWSEVFINFCSDLRRRSRCVKYQTAAVVTKCTQIIGIGYNGTMAKDIECHDHWYHYWLHNVRNREDKKDNILPDLSYAEWLTTQEFRTLHSQWASVNEVHAEVNALNWVSKYDIDDTCALYTYYAPCEQCAKQIVAYGIKTVHYLNDYHGRTHSGISGLDYLRSKGINCVKYEKNIENITI